MKNRISIFIYVYSITMPLRNRSRRNNLSRRRALGGSDIPNEEPAPPGESGQPSPSPPGSPYSLLPPSAFPNAFPQNPPNPPNLRLNGEPGAGGRRQRTRRHKSRRHRSQCHKSRRHEK